MNAFWFMVALFVLALATSIVLDGRRYAKGKRQATERPRDFTKGGLVSLAPGEMVVTPPPKPPKPPKPPRCAFCGTPWRVETEVAPSYTIHFLPTMYYRPTHGRCESCGARAADAL